MAWQAWFSLAVVGMVFGLLVATRVAPDVILLAALTLLLVFGVVGPDEALLGLSNPGMVAVAVLFVVSAGLRETGAIDMIAGRILGRPRSVTAAMMRIMLPVGAMSAFVNNTPLVAMMVPAVNDWAKKQSLAVSKLMIPLSYAAILGGTCTLIGTSTNLVVNGKLIEEEAKLAQAHQESQVRALGMFEIAWVGIPCAVAGGVYLLLIGRWLLPDRRPAMSQLQDPREYTVEMLVEANSPIAGKTIEEAGLRHLPGVYLAEIERDGLVVPAVSPHERLRSGDRLIFVGIVESVVDLQKIRGLIPAADQVFKLEAPRSDRCLIEAVVSRDCPLVGKTIREGRFRTVYQAVVVAVARSGQRLNQKVGDIVLNTADTLLLEAQPSFVDHHRSSRDFLLVSRLDDSSPPRHERASVALAIVAAMVAVVTLGWLSLLKASLLAAGAMILTRCCRATIARRSVDWQVLVTIGASFGIAQALEVSGAALFVSETLISLARDNPWLALAAVYVMTAVVTNFITNNAAALMMFPVALATAASLPGGGVNPMPFVIAVMMAASAGFATPLGYQTNLMVYGPGGYRTADFLKVGLPLILVTGIVAISLIPMIPGWEF